MDVLIFIFIEVTPFWAFSSMYFYRRLELGTKCLEMAVDERSLVCGLEDGRVDVYSRSLDVDGDCDYV